MKTKIYLVLFLVVSVSFASSAQGFSSRRWHDGWLVTTANDTIRGQIKYDLPTNSVQALVVYRGQQKILTYSSKKLMYFEIFDSNIKNYRQFYSIPYKIRTDYRAPILFEILYEGPLTLLVRERIVIETDPYQAYTYAGASVGTERLVHTFYFADTTGKIVLYSGRKGEIYEIFKKNPDKVKEYIKKNKLRIDEIRDLVRVTAFYNSL